MRTITVAAALLSFFPLAAIAQDQAKDDANQWDECKTILIPACERYLAAFSSDKERASWNRRMDENVAQKVADSPAMDDSSAFQTIALDWATDNRKSIEKKEREAIKKACMLFVRFSKTGIPPPSQVRNELTASNARELANWLNDYAETHEMVKKEKGKK